VKLNDGREIPATTLIWTAGVRPSAVIASLQVAKEKNRIRVDEYLSVPEITGLWAVGDCAAVPDSKTGEFYPPTAQHGLREGVIAAQNIERTIRGQPLRPFRYQTLGLLAAIGHRTGVAMVFGMKFSGFIAWWLWRSVYLLKLPRLAKKLRVVFAWTVDLFFGRDIEQIVTLRDVETISNRLARMQSQKKPLPVAATNPALDSSEQPAITKS
jgi:NADH dehydrogenase